MKRMVFLLCLLMSWLFSYDSIDVLNPNITVHKSGWYETSAELSAQEAKDLFEQNNFQQFPQNAQGIGFSKNTLWFAFEISTKETNENFFIDNRDIMLERCELFVFNDNKLIKQNLNGYIIPIKERPVSAFSIRFNIEKTDTKILYLLKTNSQYIRYLANAFGTESEINHTWQIRHYIFLFALGVFMALMIYNAFLYLMTQDKVYLFYILYVSSLFTLIFVVQGYTLVIYEESFRFSPLLLAFFNQLAAVGLVFFTEHFLRLKKHNPRAQKIIRYILYINLLTPFLIPIAHGLQLLNIVSMLVLFFSLLFIGFINLYQGFKPAFYYLLATGVCLLLTISYASMHQGVGLFSYTIYSANFMLAGIIWDTIFLSFALAYRIKLLREENAEQERLLMLQSRQKSIGELAGNIAHQWREPLSKMGSILSMLEAKLKYERIKKSEMLEAIMQSNHILQYLSQTINTFQDLFQNQTSAATFDVKEEILKCINFLENSLMHNDINIDFISQCTPILKGDGKQFFQALLNIILNAKDIIIAKNIKYGTIDIRLFEDTKNWIISIQDNGGGITIEPINAIFDIYETNKEQGTGMGLFIVKSIIENKLGGKISASNDKNGAVFTLLFPK